MDDIAKPANKKMTHNDYEEIRSWVNRNARVLDFTLWQYHFENGSKEAVLSALSYYQNKDGGFGKLIEPDNWNPESTPYATNFAIKILRQIDFTDISHPLYQEALRYLKNTPYQSEYGWFFTIPSNDNFPHAIWWQYNAIENEHQGIGITASLVGFILRFVNNNDELYAIALTYTDMLLEQLKNTNQYGDMGLNGYCDLLEDLDAAGLVDRFDLAYLYAKTKTLVQEKLEEISWSNHLDMSVIIPTPKSPYYKGNEKTVSMSLDELIEIKPHDGVWGIPWHWYDNGIYAKEFAISENWWKSQKAIEKLLFLQSYDRFDSKSDSIIK